MNGPRLILPNAPRASGLWVPPGSDGRLPAPSPPTLGGGVVIATAADPFPIGHGGDDPPEGMMRVAATLGNIGWPGIDYATVVELVASLPFEPAMTFLSPVAAEIHHRRNERDAQLRLAGRLIGDNPLFHRLREWVEASDDRLVFDERHLTTLQRLVVEHARDGVADELSLRERATLVTCILATGDVLPDITPPEPAAGSDYDVGAWTAFTVQTGAYYDEPYVLEAIARAYTMFVEIASEIDLRENKAFCPLDDWAAEDSDGATLAEQVAAGIAAAIGPRALDPDRALEERLGRLEPGYLKDVAVADREDSIFRALSATRPEFKAAFADDEAGPVGWDHTPFEKRPFLRRQDDTLLLLSPRLLISWLTRGLYFRMLDAAQNRPHPKRATDTRALHYTTFVGQLAERYVLRLVRDAHRRAIDAGAAVVSGEKSYRVGKDRRLSPDVAVAQPPDLVLMEVYSGRIPLPARVGGEPEDVEAALSKMVTTKLTELQRRVADVLDGHVVPPGMPPGAPRRVFPVLVHAGEGVFQTPILWRWIGEHFDVGALGDPRVAPPTICDLDDLEPLLALVERGHTLPDLLSDLNSGGYAAMPPRNWIAAAHELSADTRPRYVNAAFRRAMRDVHRRLFPDSTRFDQLWEEHNEVEPE